MKLCSLAALFAFGALGFSSAVAAPAIPDYIAKAVANPTRPAGDKKLDSVRKPAAVLTFAGVKPGQTVAEYLPGGGYYTRMLSAAVGPRGEVYALETTTWGKENIESTKSALKELGNAELSLSPIGQFNLTANVDVFWTANNYHDLHVPKYANVDMAAFNKHVFDSLKPGGTYLIVDHAAAPNTGAADSPTLHRIDKDMVVKEVTAAGFKLAGESGALHNPADDRTQKVFGMHFKTDQFILKFRKP